MKILHVIHSLDPRSGGPSHALRGLVREQVRAGHDVSVLATTVQSAEPWEPREEYVRRMREDRDLAGAETVLGAAYGRRRPWSRFAFSPECRRWLKRSLSNGKSVPEVVHIHGVFSHLTSTAASLARKRGIPYILRPAGALDAGCLQQSRHFLKRAYLRAVLQKDLNGAAFVQGTSQFESAQLAQVAPAGRVRTVPHGVDFPADSDGINPEMFYAEWPELRGRTLVLFLARIHAIKRPELLVAALERLKPEYGDLALVIAGQDAGHLEALQRSIGRTGLGGDVQFTGFLRGELKSSALAAARLSALPSEHENFGVSVVEAMAHGTPVLVTQGVAAHVYVDESGAGLTVGDGAESIAAGIRELLSADREEVGRRGRGYVREHLCWGAIVKQLDDLYREAVSRRTTVTRVRQWGLLTGMSGRQVVDADG